MQYLNVIVALSIPLLMALNALCRRPDSSKRPLLPPGPRRLPLLGNALQVPRTKLAKGLARIAGKYGPIFTLRIFSRKIVFLSNARAAADLLDKRSSIYSDRPPFPMIELVGRHHSVLFQRYDDRYHRYRRMLQRVLSARVAPDYFPLQECEARKYLLRLLDSPEAFIAHTELNPAAVILRVSFGYIVQHQDDVLVSLAKEVRDITTLASKPGRWIVDSLPWIAKLPRFLPGMGFLAWADLARERCRAHLQYPVDIVRKNMREGTALPSFVLSLLEGFPNGTPPSEHEDDMIRQVSASLFAGGTDTAFSLVLSFILQMAVHPEIQERAQAEIDAVVGQQCLPCMGDRERLPFLDCIIQELHRFSPAVPIVPHYTMADDVYQGYDIPKGTEVYGNIWAMCHDSSIYPNPEVFDPTRYVASPGKAAQPDPRAITFGFGGRLCPGRHVAQAQVFVATAHLLWAYDISPKDGIKPTAEFTYGHVSAPKEFECQIKPRSEQVVTTLRNLELEF